MSMKMINASHREYWVKLILPLYFIWRLIFVWKWTFNSGLGLAYIFLFKDWILLISFIVYPLVAYKEGEQMVFKFLHFTRKWKPPSLYNLLCIILYVLYINAIFIAAIRSHYSNCWISQGSDSNPLCFKYCHFAILPCYFTSIFLSSFLISSKESIFFVFF